MVFFLSGQGYCFNGDCPTLSMQCEKIWGYGGAAADRQCYDQFNTKGSINGHCGTDQNGHYIKCEPEYVFNNIDIFSQILKIYNKMFSN